METIKQHLTERLQSITTIDDVLRVKAEFLGRNGIVNTWKKKHDPGKMNGTDKRRFGMEFNALKRHIQNRIEKKLNDLNPQAQDLALDLTLPGIRTQQGHLHPINQVGMELEQICLSMGFMILSGWEVETDYNNFESLNTPPDHPARDMQDTFWLTNGKLLRTQTSANQVQALKKFGAPFRAVFPGKCFRYETTDATHETTFFQMEGLVVDQNISIAHVIAVMKEILSAVFKSDVKVRLRPGYFPFVEPAFELDIQCLICGGKGCPGCKQAGWLELLPCGLIHPVVLKHGNIDPEIHNGFAFGLGLTRLAMMKYRIPDIRYFNSGNYRFLEQF